MYLFGLFLVLICILGQHPFINAPLHQSSLIEAIYGTFAYPAFAFGISLWLIPALLGRAEFIRFLFGGEAWVLFTHLAYPLFLFHPLMCLYYFLSMTNTLHLDY